VALDPDDRPSRRRSEASKLSLQLEFEADIGTFLYVVAGILVTVSAVLYLSGSGAAPVISAAGVATGLFASALSQVSNRLIHIELDLRNEI
jgi:hypothetical protein